MTLPHAAPALPTPDLDSALSVLREHGLRASTARRLVLEALFQAREPVTAESIAGGLGGLLPRSDLASVYRNLETLEGLGLVRHFHLGHGPGLYGMASEEREYLVCEGCHQLRAVDPAELDGVRASILERFGFHASFKHLPIAGKCPECMRRESS
jgi:Fur family ferric uptake transcriptional regulator